MTATIESPTNQTTPKSIPQREPIFSSVEWEDAQSYWLRTSVEFSDGKRDWLEEPLCPVNEAHGLFSEILEEHRDRQRRTLLRRNPQT